MENIMIEIGKYNKLKIVKTLEAGVNLDCGDYGEVLLPKNEILSDCQIGETLEVFLYCDCDPTQCG